MLSKVIDHCPYPIQVYTPDGTLVLTNDACLALMHVQSKEQIVGKFNVLADPVIDTWGTDIRALIVRSFNGELIQVYDVKLPVRGVIDRFGIGEVSVETIFLDITCFPVHNSQSQLEYIVHLFIPARLYSGKEEIVHAKEYIETHWLEDFDLDKLARAVNLSRRHLVRLFKNHTDMTPFGYYQNIKIRKLKEKLGDRNVSIGGAFSACGVNYNGNYARLFREKTGMTPSQYRKNIWKT
jgi:AraC-like DNA-binding protein